MKLLDLPANLRTCIFAVKDGNKVWIGMTRNYFRCYSQFLKQGKVKVSPDATFEVLEFCHQDKADYNAALHCRNLGAKMIPRRRAKGIIRTDIVTGGEIKYDNIIQACVDLNTSPGTVRKAIESGAIIQGYKFKNDEEAI